MSDLLREADEALREERIFAFWKQNAPYILSFMALAVLGTGLMSAYRAWDRNARETSTMQALMLLDDAAFPDNLQEGEEMPARANMDALVRLSAAGQYIDLGEPEQAASLYDEVKQNKSVSKTWRRLAALMAHNMNGGSALSSEDIKMLTAQDSPWQAEGYLALAMSHARQQDFTEARRYLGLVLEDTALPPSLRERAAALDMVFSVAQRDQAGS